MRRTLVAAALFCLALAAQNTNTQYAHVSVTDPMNRFVTGLQTEHFQIMDNGSLRTPTTLHDVDSPITIVVVGAVDRLADASVTQAATLDEALRILAASNTARKALILASPAMDSSAIPANIHALRIDASNISKAVVEVRNTYTLGFAQLTSADIKTQIALKQPKGLPVLKAHVQ